MTTADNRLSAGQLGIPPVVRAAIIWALTDAGFPRPDAETWATGWACRPDPALVVHEAIAYDDHGIPLTQAIDWHQHGFYAYEATGLYDIRWTPADAATIRDLLYDTGIEIDEWAVQGLPADRVIAYLLADVHIDEVDIYEAEPGGPVAVLGMLAALIG